MNFCKYSKLSLKRHHETNDFQQMPHLIRQNMYKYFMASQACKILYTNSLSSAYWSWREPMPLLRVSHSRR